MKSVDIANQVFLWTIVAMSLLIAIEFIKSVDGKLRVLMIRLFLTKVWLYGGYASIVLLGWKFDGYMRLVFNFPMFIIMIDLYAYIRHKNKMVK